MSSAEMREAAVKVVEDFAKPWVLHTQTGAMMFRACVEKIVAAIRALPDSSAWQPIETAPKNGKRIDLFGSVGKHSFRVPGCYWDKRY